MKLCDSCDNGLGFVCNMSRLIFINDYVIHHRFYELLSSEIQIYFILFWWGKGRSGNTVTIVSIAKVAYAKNKKTSSHLQFQGHDCMYLYQFL